MLVSTVFVLGLLFQNGYTESKDNEKSLAAAVAGMVSLLETERQLLSALENYANLMERKLRIIRKFV